MSKVSELAQLRDIHLPGPVGWWPLAPGWYVLMVLVFLVGFGLLFIFYRKSIHARPKLQALNLLKQYRISYEKDKNSQVMSSRVSELLRRVALVYFPREKVASLHGESWILFLNQTAKGVDFVPVQGMLLELPFKPAQQINLEPLFERVELWIRQREVPCLN